MAGDILAVDVPVIDVPVIDVAVIDVPAIDFVGMFLFGFLAPFVDAPDDERPDGDCCHDDRAAPTDVLLNGVVRVAGEIAHQDETDPPNDAPRGVESKESPVGHPRNAGE